MRKGAIGSVAALVGFVGIVLFLGIVIGICLIDPQDNSLTCAAAGVAIADLKHLQKAQEDFDKRLNKLAFEVWIMKYVKPPVRYYPGRFMWDI